jgi:phenol hydroxylase P4 protein
MTVTSTKHYEGVPRHPVENFGGNQINYVSWDHHLLFAAPFCLCPNPDMKLADFLEDIVNPLLAADPDAEKLDWHKVVWQKGLDSWQPDLDKTLRENGVGHKDLLRFKTPGMNSLGA